VSTPRRFLELTNRNEARWVKVKKDSDTTTKFKLRTGRYLYTIAVKEQFVKLVTNSLPPTREVIHPDQEDKKCVNRPSLLISVNNSLTFSIKSFGYLYSL
jgi:large subunit ribosomal protein L38e